MEKQVTFYIKIESNGAEVIHKVTAEAGELAKVINDVTEAQTELDSQMMAEVKLDTIMKQRMDATDGMVESIKNLCSEQQKLGVQRFYNPQSAMSVMRIAAYLFEHMSLRFEGAMGFRCYQ